jgi:hypothetical protein
VENQGFSHSAIYFNDLKWSIFVIFYVYCGQNLLNDQLQRCAAQPSSPSSPEKGPVWPSLHEVFVVELSGRSQSRSICHLAVSRFFCSPSGHEKHFAKPWPYMIYMDDLPIENDDA